MDVQQYTEWSETLCHRASTDRVPISGSFEVTRRCNLQCVHCYNNLPLGDERARQSELRPEEHFRILDEITEAGCLWILYTGGEVFARSDFLQIYTYAKKKGLIITIFTNGTRITPQIADYLENWPPFSIEITIYGYTRETHERVTGVPGSYEQCMRGIGLLMERHLPLKLKSMAMTINGNEIRDMKRFCEEDLGVEFKFDAMINPRIDGSKGPLAFRLTPREVVSLDLRDKDRMTGWEQFCGRFLRVLHDPDPSDLLYQCGGGLNSFAIDPSGKLSACVLSRRDVFDLRTGSFREGWEHFLLERRNKKRTRMTRCVSCRIRSMCGMCPAIGELEGGDPEEPVDFLCRVAHLRAHALGFPVEPDGDVLYGEEGNSCGERIDAATPFCRSSQERGE